MIIGIGTDILKISRIKLEHSKRVLNTDELVVFNSFNNAKRKIEYLAGRFALKEAIIKAIGNTEYSIGMRDICILNDDKGKPFFANNPFKDLKVHISISHEKEYCIGFCIIENV